MIIKDLENQINALRNSKADVYLIEQEQTAEGINESYIKANSLDDLIAYAKIYFTDDLVSKENSNKKIVGLKVWN